jgi:formylglycine-generating enzyme required for sulfatase activity
MSQIFLSHSSANNAQAIAVRDWMLTQGWDDIFLDLNPESGLKAGERWQDALKRAAERCEIVIFLVSPVWADSKWCLAEFLLAKCLNKRMFALIVEPTPFAALPVELTAEWQVADLTAGTRDYSATVTLPPGDKTATVTFGSEGLNRLRIGLMQAGINASHFDWPPANDPNRPPYRGLKPFEADDAGIFFGRDAAVIGALDGLRGLRDAAPPRLLVILGASGAGKSSFLRAGLIPRLARDDRNFYVLPIIRPERAAITGENGLLRVLEGAFQAARIAAARADIRAAIEGGAATLRPLLQRLADKVTLSIADAATKPSPVTLVLAIDQGEELFLAEGQDEARTFLTLLRYLLVDDAPSVIALFTIRSDNYERLQLAKELDGVKQVTLSLPPMPKGAYVELIKGPANRLNGTARALKVDDALVDALLTDIEAGGAKDSLPLLAFTLERLYAEYRGGGNLKLEHYVRLGGIAGSIEAAVEEALKAADTDPKIPMDRKARLALLRRGLIPWVAGIDPDTGAPRRRVARLVEIPAEARPLIDLLVDQRLLSTDLAKDTEEKTIEPAHEALLRQWRQLQGWLKEDSGLLGVMDGVQRASRDWAANVKSATWLIHTTDRLTAAERLLKRADLAANLEPTDWDYLAACREAERAAAEKERSTARTRQRLRVVVSLLMVGVIVGLIGWINQSYLKERANWFWVMRPYMLKEVRPDVLTANAELALKPADTFRECVKDCPEMTVVPAGEFMMGSPETEKDRYDPEGPQHKVSIARAFAVSKFDVTFADWDACVSVGGCPKVSDSGYGRGRQPVINVSWDEAKIYVAWFSRMTDRPYRLLTEAEWEYAARAGTATAYYWGEEIGKANANCNGCGSEWDNRKTSPVGSFNPNAFGLYDMAGNVTQWVEDCYHDSYDDETPWDGSEWTAEDCYSRVHRGGSFAFNPQDLRAAGRYWGTPGVRSNFIGFRLARSLRVLTAPSSAAKGIASSHQR